MSDISGALEAIEAVRSMLPAEGRQRLDAELITRYGTVTDAVGTVAVATEVVCSVKLPDTKLTTLLPTYLNPTIAVPMQDQMSVMAEFWGALGREVPTLHDDQQTKLAYVLAAHPTHRFVAAPLLDLSGRKAVAETAKTAFANNKFNPSYSALWAPDSSWTYGKLLAEPASTVKDGKDTYGMRYKTLGNVVATRAAYVDELQAAGITVTGEQNTPWTMHVMDTQVRAPRSRDTVRNLFAKVTPTTTPEALITMQLLHQAAGTPNPAWEVDFANEAVFRLNKNGSPMVLQSAASVDWYPYDAQVSLYDWGADDKYDSFGVRAEESGL